eukprot:TRINITY_DN15682_c1_g2_i2.p1 TRINITY_DN15682_c1_g2~~TRINITY_DN15682_c1_g2_i2.p1  ORF type:complete len:372 (-),score=130.89 TRINITY_DN15682_c1_g2_i2:198-1313(-)
MQQQQQQLQRQMQQQQMAHHELQRQLQTQLLKQQQQQDELQKQHEQQLVTQEQLEQALRASPAKPGMPPPDSVTMKTWLFLKESMGKLRDEVRQIMLVRDDMAAMKEDLKTQEGMWRQAEKEQILENHKLAAEVQALRNEAIAGRNVKSEVQALRLGIEAERLKAKETKSAALQEELSRDHERTFYARRKEELNAKLRELNRTAEADIARAHQRQLDLQTDSVALTLRSTELHSKLNSGMQELVVDQQQATAKKDELYRQLDGLREGLARVQGQLQLSGTPEQQKAKLLEVQTKLDQEVAEMVTVKQEHNQVLANCANVNIQQKDVLRSERVKAQKRHRESIEFCQPVHGQVEALQQLVAHCRALDEQVVA